MLLRRITQHVKDQNWTAIGIDFVIVVVGVFIGIQVSNWNAARTDRDREAFILDALKEDFRTLDEAASYGVFYHERAVDGLTVIAAALRDGTFPDVDRERFEDGLRFGYLNSAFSGSATLAEIMSSGQFSLIRDSDMRRALSEYEGFRANAFRTSADIRLMVTAYMPAFTSRFNYDLDQNNVRSDSSSVSRFGISDIGAYDFDAMRSDPVFREAVEELRELQRLWLNWNDVSLRHVREVRRQLGDLPAGDEAAS